MNSFVGQQSSDDFYRARNKALLNDIQNFLNPEKTNLLSFYEIKGILKPKNEVYVGIKTVPLNLIVGSEGRYTDFDNHFFPKSMHLKTRWERVDQAHLTDYILPPIKLYELGGLYFVRDGNHRVSVAKTQKVAEIDAEVVSLQSEIKLKPGLTSKKILKAVLQYEKRVFYAETAFGDITDCWTIDFSTPGQYDVIYNQILIHKYYINEKQTEEITMPAAELSWYQNIYVPVIQVIEKYRLLRKFSGRTKSDLYVWIIKYWDDLKQKYGSEYSLDEATQHFTREFAEQSFADKIKVLFSKLFS